MFIIAVLYYRNIIMAWLRVVGSCGVWYCGIIDLNNLYLLGD